MSKTTDRLLRETKALIKQVESGETVRAAWIAIQDRVRRLCEDNSKVAVGKSLSKSDQWVGVVLGWNSTSSGSPFSREARAEKGEPSPDVSTAKKVARENPEAIVAAIAAAPAAVQRKIRDGIEEVRAGAEEKFDAGRPKPKRKADWGEISTRLYSARRGAEQSLNELRTLGRDQLDDEIADDLLDQAERTVGAYELLAAFLRGRDTIEDIERFLAEQEV